MDDEALKAGKARVQEHLIEPLEVLGMQRAPRATLGQHEAFLEGLKGRLAYMSADGLQALAEVVEANGEGKRRDRWPSGMQIMKWASRLEAPPESDSRLVRSYLASAAGDRAAAGGYLAELYRHLKRFGAPPNDFAERQMATEADEAQRRLERLQRAEAEGRAEPAEQAWARDRAARLARAEAIRAAEPAA